MERAARRGDADGGSSIVAYERYLESDDPRAARDPRRDRGVQLGRLRVDLAAPRRGWRRAAPEAERESARSRDPPNEPGAGRPSCRGARRQSSRRSQNELAAGVAGERDERSRRAARALAARSAARTGTGARRSPSGGLLRPAPRSFRRGDGRRRRVHRRPRATKREVGQVRQSTVHRYKFVPQDHKFAIGDDPVRSRDATKRGGHRLRHRRRARHDRSQRGRQQRCSAPDDPDPGGPVPHDRAGERCRCRRASGWWSTGSTAPGRTAPPATCCCGARRGFTGAEAGAAISRERRSADRRGDAAS